MMNRKRQRILDIRHEWRCGRPVRLNSRMKRESNRSLTETTSVLLDSLLSLDSL